jgi:hypothetical protein
MSLSLQTATFARSNRNFRPPKTSALWQHPVMTGEEVELLLAQEKERT